MGVGGGGGGAGAVGSNGIASPAAGGAGGAGVASTITGSSVTRGGGGGGGSESGTGGAGGAGGGGAGVANTTATAGTANTGGGGGGAGAEPNGVGAAGGSGVVIISYASPQLFGGGTVTLSGGNVIHTFTSTGYLAPLKYVNNSLRFRSSATAYLNRTFVTPTSTTKWTWSGWVKRGTLGAAQTLFSGQVDVNNWGIIAFLSGDTLSFQQADSGSVTSTVTTTQVFRDPAAWYHIQVAFDSTQATAANRLLMYINGVQVTAFGTATYLAQNTASRINAAVAHQIARYISAAQYLDGYMAEVNFIDGQALTSNSFGGLNSYGVWQPITYGGSYGTNGFYLPFSQTAPTGTPSVSTSYVVVAGGGGGGGNYGGGGGAGGYLSGSSFSVSPGSTYAVTVGAGGAGGGTTGTSGTNSVFSTITATGGGRGASVNHYAASTGGSGGGGNYNYFTTGASGNTPSTSPSQGNNGGNGALTFSGGGGGGASAVGGNASGTTGGNGGAGTASSITGSSVTRGGGGGGGASSTAGTGGAGGGGAGKVGAGTATAGTANTGGGGGGGGDDSGGAGGSGVVIISYAGSQVFSGGTVTSSGGNTIHTFTTSSLLTYNITADFSPNGNNWTPNNISTTLGVTYDSMTDVPTLTSATAANYCVLNPLDKYTNVTLSNANLSATFSAYTGFVRATFALPSTGQWYWEGTVPTSDVRAEFGIATFTQALGVDPQVAAGCWFWYSNGASSNKFNAGTGTSWGTAWASGDIIGIAFDADAGTLTYYKNGTLQGGGAAATGLTGTYSPMIGFGNVTSTAISINFGQRPFSYTPPTGYVALNTYNL